MRWQLASTTFALTAMSAACYGPGRIVCEKDGVPTGVLCPDNLVCTGNTNEGEVLCASEEDVGACTGTDRERTPCVSPNTGGGLCIANVCTSCAALPDDFECRYSQWTQMVSPAQRLSAVWMSAPDDAYAVGGANGDVLHYDGDAWSRIATLPGAEPQGVWSGDNTVVIIALDGSVYHDLSSTPRAQAPVELRAIGGTSASNLIAVGADHVFGRWNGSSWTWSPSSGFASYEGLGVVGDAIIAVDQGSVARLSGATFTSLPALPNGHTNDFLDDVWGTSGDDFYVVGGHGASLTMGVIHHFVNGAWATPIVLSRRLTAIWGFPTTAYAVGRAGLIATFDGTAWSEQTIETSPDFTDIAGSDGDAIAVTSSGTIWRISPP